MIILLLSSTRKVILLASTRKVILLASTRTRILAWQYSHFLITFFLHTRTHSTRTRVILYSHLYTRVALLAIGTVGLLRYKKKDS